MLDRLYAAFKLANDKYATIDTGEISDNQKEIIMSDHLMQTIRRMYPDIRELTSEDFYPEDVVVFLSAYYPNISVEVKENID